MTKTQKIWMWIFIAMFAIPEILWGNLVKIFKISFLPIYKNAQYFSDNPTMALFIIIIEIIGVLGVLYLLNKKNPQVNIVSKYVFDVVLAIIFLALIASLYLSFAMSQISFS
jgi:hypothetical protein